MSLNSMARWSMDFIIAIGIIQSRIDFAQQRDEVVGNAFSMHYKLVNVFLESKRRKLNSSPLSSHFQPDELEMLSRASSSGVSRSPSPFGVKSRRGSQRLGWQYIDNTLLMCISGLFLSDGRLQLIFSIKV